jgi:hypothetical protein
MSKYIFYFMDRTNARMKFCTLKDHGHIYKFWFPIFFVGAFEYGCGSTF